MKPVLIVPIELFPQVNITNYRFVIKIGEVDQIQKALEIVKEHDKCMSVLCDLNNVDIVSILGTSIKSSVNVYINCAFDGEILPVIKCLESLQNQEHSQFITYLFPPDTPNLVTLLKVLSSCGYKSGLTLDYNKTISKDDFIELATYSYLTPVPHAQIEPFGFIQQEIHDKVKYVDINKFYFISPDTFAHVAIDGGVDSKCEFDVLQRRLCNSIEELSQIDFSDIAMEYKKLRFYNHFNAEDECSKCANYKACAGFYKNRFEDCQKTMSMIYEMLF